LIWQKGQRRCKWKSGSVFVERKADWAYGNTSRASRSDWEFLWQNSKLLVLEFDVRTRASWNLEQWYDLWFWFQECWKSIWILSRYLVLFEVSDQSNNQTKLWRDQAGRDLFSPKLLRISSSWKPSPHKVRGRNWGMFAYLIRVREEHLPFTRCCQRQSRLQSRQNQDKAHGTCSAMKRNSWARPNDPDRVRSAH